MKRVTTPTHAFTFPEAVSVGNLSQIVITYAQGCRTILTKVLNDLRLDAETNVVALALTQEESGLFAPGNAMVQVRAKTMGGKVVASQIINFEIKPVINEEIL